MKRILKYSSWTAAFILVLILSVDIHKTGGGGTGIDTDTFDPKVYALSFLENDLPAVLERAPEADQILKLLVTDKDQALNGFAHVLGISRSYYFLVKGEGNIKSIENEYVTIETKDGNIIKLATDFIFGNAVRDGSGLVDIDQFLNMTDFNNVSIEINKLIKERVIKGFKEQVRTDMQIRFSGAFEINMDDLNLSEVIMIPVSLNVQNGRE
jgi:hypothetical protein